MAGCLDSRARGKIHRNVHRFGKQRGALNSNTVIHPVLSETPGRGYADAIKVFRASGFADLKSGRQQSGSGIVVGMT